MCVRGVWCRKDRYIREGLDVEGGGGGGAGVVLWDWLKRKGVVVVMWEGVKGDVHNPLLIFTERGHK